MINSLIKYKLLNCFIDKPFTKTKLRSKQTSREQQIYFKGIKSTV